MWKIAGRCFLIVLFCGVCLACLDDSHSQEPPINPSAKPPEDEQRGVEVQARGPIHEAFATPSSESKMTPIVARKPPAPIEELPPDERPEGDVVWIGGYWAHDDDRQDYLWVSGCWRAKPASREWVPGYWREVGNGWQWVAGFWTVTSQGGQPTDVTYHPEPPAPPKIAPPPPPAEPDQFFVPGTYVWVDSHYAWRAGYYTRVRPGYVYVPGHYRWTPRGYLYIAGYWDLALPRRGLLYAPIIVDPVLVGPRFVYTPTYAVTDTIIVDTLFVRPGHGCYYFGDYYGPRYAGMGFVSGVVYSRGHYDAVVVYQRYQYRDNPRWLDIQVNLAFDRHNGRAPLPPRTLTQQRNVTNVTNITNVKNVTNVTNVLAPAKSVVSSRGARTVAVDQKARVHAKQHSQAVQHAAAQQRHVAETHTGAPLTKPHPTALKVPPHPSHQPTGKAPVQLDPPPPPSTPKGPRPVGPDPKNPLGKTPIVKPPVEKGPVGKTPVADPGKSPPPVGPRADPTKGRPSTTSKNPPPDDTKKKK